jgi:CheY-like chemotaxis protein
MRVFILEDLPDRIGAYFIKFMKHDVVVANNVKDALNCLKNNTFDLVVLDHDLDGRAFVPITNPNCGSIVAEYLADTNYQGKVVIGSLNPTGAQNMKRLLPQAIVAPGYWMKDIKLVGNLQVNDSFAYDSIE